MSAHFNNDMVVSFPDEVTGGPKFGSEGPRLTNGVAVRRHARPTGLMLASELIPVIGILWLDLLLLLDDRL
jgi:hypothetical protein